MQSGIFQLIASPTNLRSDLRNQPTENTLSGELLSADMAAGFSFSEAISKFSHHLGNKEDSNLDSLATPVKAGSENTSLFSTQNMESEPQGDNLPEIQFPKNGIKQNLAKHDEALSDHNTKVYYSGEDDAPTHLISKGNQQASMRLANVSPPTEMPRDAFPVSEQSGDNNKKSTIDSKNQLSTGTQKEVVNFNRLDQTRELIDSEHKDIGYTLAPQFAGSELSRKQIGSNNELGQKHSKSHEFPGGAKPSVEGETQYPDLGRSTDVESPSRVVAEVNNFSKDKHIDSKTKHALNQDGSILQSSKISDLPKDLAGVSHLEFANQRPIRDLSESIEPTSSSSKDKAQGSSISDKEVGRPAKILSGGAVNAVRLQKDVPEHQGIQNARSPINTDEGNQGSVSPAFKKKSFRESNLQTNQKSLNTSENPNALIDSNPRPHGLRVAQSDDTDITKFDQPSSQIHRPNLGSNNRQKTSQQQLSNSKNDTNINPVLVGVDTVKTKPVILTEGDLISKPSELSGASEIPDGLKRVHESERSAIHSNSNTSHASPIPTSKPVDSRGAQSLPKTQVKSQDEENQVSRIHLETNSQTKVETRTAGHPHLPKASQSDRANETGVQLAKDGFITKPKGQNRTSAMEANEGAKRTSLSLGDDVLNRPNNHSGEANASPLKSEMKVSEVSTQKKEAETTKQEFSGTQINNQVSNPAKISQASEKSANAIIAKGIAGSKPISKTLSPDNRVNVRGLKVQQETVDGHSKSLVDNSVAMIQKQGFQNSILEAGSNVSQTSGVLSPKMKDPQIQPEVSASEIKSSENQRPASGIAMGKDSHATTGSQIDVNPDSNKTSRAQLTKEKPIISSRNEAFPSQKEQNQIQSEVSAPEIKSSENQRSASGIAMGKNSHATTGSQIDVNPDSNKASQAQLTKEKPIISSRSEALRKQQEQNQVAYTHADEKMSRTNQESNINAVAGSTDRLTHPLDAANTNSLRSEINASDTPTQRKEVQNSDNLAQFNNNSKTGIDAAIRREMVMHTAENTSEGAKSHQADETRPLSRGANPSESSHLSGGGNHGAGSETPTFSQDKWKDQNTLNGIGKMQSNGQEDGAIVSAPTTRDANAITISGQTAAVKAEAPQKTSEQIEQFGENLVKEVAKLRPLRNGAIQLSVNTGSKELVINLVQKGEWVEARLIAEGDEGSQIAKNLTHMNDVLSRHQIRVIASNDDKFESTQSQTDMEASKEGNRQGARQARGEGQNNNQDIQNGSDLSGSIINSAESVTSDENLESEQIFNQFA